MLLQIHFISALLILSTACSNSNSEAESPQAVTVIDSTVVRSQTNTRNLLYKNDSTISYCESTGGDINTYSGYRDLKPYALASVSKIFLSAWALNKLGPDYRFQMIWKLKKISNDGTFDAILQTNYDPVVNIEKILLALAELKKNGVTKIRNLIIDETTHIYLSVLSNPHLELTDVPVTINQTIENLNIILNSKNWSSQTQTALENLKNPETVPTQFSVEQISYLPRQQINTEGYNQTVQISSAILLKYLKNLNTFSNNYVTDSLFAFLGGAAEFENFQRNDLKIPKAELQIYTGSGLSTEVLGRRQDNLGSCLSVLKTLKYLDGLAVNNNLNLGHVLLTAGVDSGTYESNMTFNNNIVLKTGRLFDVPTLNVAGVSSSTEGHTYFAFMAHDFDNTDEANVKIKRDQLISDLIQFKQQRNSFFTMGLDTLF